MDRITRSVVSVVAGVAAAVAYFLLVLPSGCNDVGGVPSWERCITVLGTPAFSVEDFGWDNNLEVIPLLLVGLLVGLFTWWAIGVAAKPDNTRGPIKQPG